MVENPVGDVIKWSRQKCRQILLDLDELHKLYLTELKLENERLQPITDFFRPVSAASPPCQGDHNAATPHCQPNEREKERKLTMWLRRIANFKIKLVGENASLLCNLYVTPIVTIINKSCPSPITQYLKDNIDLIMQ